MKKKIAALLAGALCLSALTACGGGSDTQTAEGGASDDKTIVVGASPHTACGNPERGQGRARRGGLDARGGGVHRLCAANTALVDGDLDANYFQHIPYLNNFNKEITPIWSSAIEMHYEPFGIYPARPQRSRSWRTARPSLCRTTARMRPVHSCCCRMRA